MSQEPTPIPPMTALASGGSPQEPQHATFSKKNPEKILKKNPSPVTQSMVQKIRDWRANSALFIRDHFKIELDEWQKDVCGLWDAGHKRIAMLACKGPGKTALLAMLIWQFLFTRRQSKVACTSVSGDNMRDGLWTELAKWRQVSPWLVATFEWQKERIIAKDKPETHWASARTWSQSADIRQQANTLAGLHADYILFVIDEAGGVPDSVSVSAEAALASGIESRFLIAGNPTECQGPLWRAAGKDKALWKVVSISGDPDDPKRSPRVDKEWARSQIEQHGVNNPWVLANVFGKFPPSSPNTFIPRELVVAARKREATATMYDAFTIGVDVARFGDDEAVISFKKGNDARTHPAVKFRNIDNMALAARVADFAIQFGADAVFVDGGGNGGGVVDRLMQLNIPNVIEVQFGGKSDRVPYMGETAVYDNKAAEMAGKMKKWLEHGAIEDSDELERQLCERRYGHNLRYGRDAIALEPKDEMKKRGLDSPDWFDSLSLHFAYPVEKTVTAGREAASYTLPQTVQHEYDPYRDMHVQEAA